MPARSPRAKPKLLAFVSLTREEDAVGVTFKLDRERAEEEIEKRDYVERHSFRTLGGAGWVTAVVRNQRQVGRVGRLLEESRTLYPAVEEAKPEAAETHGRAAADPVARRIDSVMREASQSGWRPAQDWE